MNLEGARRVMETTSVDTANQYLRFGWKLINQYVTPAAPGSPAIVNYVLASLRNLEDTKQIITLTDPDQVNEHLKEGWTLVEKYVTSSSRNRREETAYFVLAWQNMEEPANLG